MNCLSEGGDKYYDVRVINNEVIPAMCSRVLPVSIINSHWRCEICFASNDVAYFDSVIGNLVLDVR